ncbi:MAG: hypothetical protein GY948_11030 [Alphaproteobacteria bacterium]|nr:hypothetical protein [Alphaproteobacteria bacterium]
MFYKLSYIFILILTGLALNVVPAFAQKIEFEILKKLPAQVSQVESGGFWSKGDDEGFFRVVVTSGGIEHVENKLFVQMMKLDKRTQTYDAVKTLSINETNMRQGNVIKIDTDFGDVNAFEVNVESSSRGNETKRFKLILNGSGGYKLKMQK